MHPLRQSFAYSGAGLKSGTAKSEGVQELGLMQAGTDDGLVIGQRAFHSTPEPNNMRVCQWWEQFSHALTQVGDGP